MAAPYRTRSCPWNQRTKPNPQREATRPPLSSRPKRRDLQLPSRPQQNPTLSPPGYRSGKATAPNFVIPTGAKRGGGICSHAFPPNEFISYPCCGDVLEQRYFPLRLLEGGEPGFVSGRGTLQATWVAVHRRRPTFGAIFV
jgi:hypothetical protein